MGGHGGLNILPQKRWNVYNYDNREKVRRDEEAAVREEHIKQQEARRRDAELRLEKLRQAKRGFESHHPSQIPHPAPSEGAVPQTLSQENKESDAEEDQAISDSKHINLFDGWNGFQREAADGKASTSDRKEKWHKVRDGHDEDGRKKRKKTSKQEEESVRAVLPEDEVYRLGYGSVGKDVKAPWYLSKSVTVQYEEEERGNKLKESFRTNNEKTEKKKSLKELREERLRREQKERERAQKLLFPNDGNSTVKPDISVQKRTPYYNTGFGNAR